MYNSFDLASTFLQMRDNLHLFLLDTEVIKDEDKIEILDIRWQGDWRHGQKFLFVRVNNIRDIEVDAEIFDSYVETGFRVE